MLELSYSLVVQQLYICFIIFDLIFHSQLYSIYMNVTNISHQLGGYYKGFGCVSEYFVNQTTLSKTTYIQTQQNNTASWSQVKKLMVRWKQETMQELG